MNSKLQNIGIIAAITAKDYDTALEFIKSCIDGGINGIEINYATPKVYDITKKVKELYPDILVGVAEIPDNIIAQELIMLGVDYITTPYNDYSIYMSCNNIDNLTYIPGCMTLSEINNAKKQGLDIIKLYPAQMLKPEYIKIVNSTVKYINVMPAGGINLDNIESWFLNGAKCIVIGDYLMKSKDLEEMKIRSEKLVEKFETIKCMM